MSKYFDILAYLMGKQAGGGGGGDITVVSKSISANGTYTAPSGKAYSPVTVDVPNSYTESDEGKVVSNGELVAQGSDTVTQNGPVDTTLISSLTVNVSGGGDEEAPEKDVNFIDYDGKILYSYTAAEAQALTELPANPSHSGLTAQGWNWTLAEIKAQLTAVPGGPIWVGQQYVTTSGATEIDIRLTGDALSPYLILGVTGTSNINWGDGSSDTLTGTSYTTAQFIQHTYANPGDYTIAISGGQYRFNGASGKCGVLSNEAGHTSNSMYSNCVLAICGGATSEFRGFANYPLKNCARMRYVTIPSTCSDIGQAFVAECFALHAVVIPRAYTGGNYAKFNRSLQRISWAAGWTTFGTQSIQQCDSLQSVTIPTGTTAIGNNAFADDRSLKKMYIPGTVTSIGTSAFSNCYSMTEYHLFPTSPPILGGTNAFNNIQSWCKIYVPYSADHSILNAYKTETNWASYADYMQEEPQ